ncbi:MAG: hypothetical protein ABJN65_02580 [Parasphingorhabdus sp.]
MSDDDKKPDAKEDGEDKKSGKWSTGAKVGAAVGSAAVAAALMYAGRHKMRKIDEQKTGSSKTRYENEPVDDDEAGDDAE